MANEPPLTIVNIHQSGVPSEPMRTVHLWFRFGDRPGVLEFRISVVPGTPDQPETELRAMALMLLQRLQGAIEKGE